MTVRFLLSPLAILLTTANVSAAPMCKDKPASPRKAPVYKFFTAPASITPNQQYLETMFSHLAGAPVPMSDPRFVRALGLLDANDKFNAAQVVMTDPNFLKVRVRNFSLQYINKDYRKQDTLTDLQAMIIGVTRDDIDARQILTGNFGFQGYGGLGLPSVSRANNDHFAQFEARDLDFVRDMIQVSPQWPDGGAGAGALTSRAWSAAFYNAGTNRLGLKYAIDAFLCVPINSWKIRGLPDYYVRRDVTRTPGGNPSAYQNDCRGCHAAMDGLGGAFAKLDFTNNQAVFMSAGVAPKMNNNPQIYPEGFVVTDDSWVNLLDQHPTVDFGWRSPTEGKGIEAFASLIANSKAYSRCFVQNAFLEVCGRTIQEAAPAALETLAQGFEQDGYKLKNLFAKVVTMNECLAYPATGVK